MWPKTKRERKYLITISLQLFKLMCLCRGKFLGTIYLRSNCKRENRAIQTPKNLREKSAEGKTTEEREISPNQRDCKKLLALVTESIL